jgi:hypothetical protein
MPLLSRTFIKAGLIYFVLALIAGALTVARPVLNLPATIGALYPVYLHLLMVGWVTQLIIGVAYWMFPKYSKERPRRSERLGWAVFGLLNVGLILRAFGEPLLVVKPEWNVGWMLAASAVLQALGGWAFVINTWGRVKER